MTIAWTPDRRAEALVPQRERLLDELLAVVPAARRLTDDERELVIDDALSYVVMEYTEPIASPQAAERVFWTAAALRVSRVLDGRHATVRGQFQRASDEALEHVADSLSDPAEVVQRKAEFDLAAEFAVTLDEVEGQVLRVKWLSGGHAPLGYKRVAARLSIPVPRVRLAERTIAKKIDAFAATCSAGRLCDERAGEIAALAEGTTDAHSVRIAKAHIKHCAVCKTEYVAQLRAVRSAAFERDVASLVPVLPLAETARRHGGSVRDLLADWVSRIGGSDVSTVTSQAASSGVGRGTGGVLAMKVAAVLVAGATTVGVTTGIVDGPKEQPKPRSEPAAKPTPSPTPVAIPDMNAAIAAAKRAVARREARRETRAAKAKAKTQGGTGATDQEQAPASAAPSGSQSNGGSEFSSDSANLDPAPPAPVPAAPGASEFP